MSDQQILTIGYVPVDCSSERITCGDCEASGTKEVTLVIQDNKISCVETGASIEVNTAEFFNEKSKLWKQVVKSFCGELSDKELKPNMLGACWGIFLDEISGKKGVTKLADDGDGGEFHNRGGCNRGTFYVRYQLEEDDGNYFGEKVLGFE